MFDEQDKAQLAEEWRLLNKAIDKMTPVQRADFDIMLIYTKELIEEDPLYLATQLAAHSTQVAILRGWLDDMPKVSIH